MKKEEKEKNPSQVGRKSMADEIEKAFVIGEEISISDDNHCHKLPDGGEFYIGKTPPIKFFQEQHGCGPSGCFSK